MNHIACDVPIQRQHLPMTRFRLSSMKFAHPEVPAEHRVALHLADDRLSEALQGVRAEVDVFVLSACLRTEVAASGCERALERVLGLLYPNVELPPAPSKGWMLPPSTARSMPRTSSTLPVGGATGCGSTGGSPSGTHGTASGMSTPSRATSIPPLAHRTRNGGVRSGKDPRRRAGPPRPATIHRTTPVENVAAMVTAVKEGPRDQDHSGAPGAVRQTGTRYTSYPTAVEFSESFRAYRLRRAARRRTAVR